MSRYNHYCHCCGHLKDDGHKFCDVCEAIFVVLAKSGLRETPQRARLHAIITYIARGVDD